MSDEIKFIRNLSGFSGCEIRLYSCGKSNFVRKVSSSKEYNFRLKKQMGKQIYFGENLAFDNVKTPKVLNTGMEGELFFFDMEYINGTNLIEHVLASPPEELKKIASMIVDILEKIESTTTGENLKVGLKVFEKLEEIEYKIGEEIPDSELIRKNLRGLTLEKGFCHGDLTFENILYDKESNNYYLIDFLDGFVDNYFFDIVKLFQDLEGEWYLLRNPNIDKKIMEIKMYFIKEYILEKYLKDKDYMDYHSALLKLNFARILPYAKKENFQKVLKIMEQINLSGFN